MNNYIQTIILFIFSSLIQVVAIGQLVDKGIPVSWKEKGQFLERTSMTILPPVDMAKVHKEDAINDQDKSHPWRFAFNHEVNYNMSNSGEWTELPNGDRIWRFTMHSPGAISMNVVFSDFYIPEGAMMHMYNGDRSHVVGAYTSVLNNPDRILGTELVEGDIMTIEYFEPQHVKNKGSLKIETVAHGYRSLVAYAKEIIKGLNDSGNCNHDVRCPLGDGWEDQIRSVGLIIVNGNSGCSGALINNTRFDGHPYFLTANHCLGNPANWVFRFHWDSPQPSCGTTAPSANGPFVQTAFNGRLLASARRSDFALVEINNPIPESWDVYYAGWDRTDIPPDFVIGIHHPRGDIKKICRDDDTPYYSVSNQAQVWWLDQWETGVTEPGSSGSPLFDHNGRIIGQLFGGLAACSNNPTTENNGLHDYYGRFAISWEGTLSNNQLKDWLDPIGTEDMIIDGYDPAVFVFPHDIALLSVGDVQNVLCGDSLLIAPVIRNRGTELLTSFAMVITVGGEVFMDTLFWEGELPSGDTLYFDTLSVLLTGGLNQIEVTLLNPNGEEDGNPQNSFLPFTIYSFNDPEVVIFTLITDCWGSEITWDIQDTLGHVIYSGGPFNDSASGETLEFELCLDEGCYVFNIYDSFGDGLNGSQYFQCAIDGDFYMTSPSGELLFQMSAPNGAFGSQETHEFCVENTVLSAAFTASQTELCSESFVQFEDLSTGGVLERLWIFPGGSPGASTDANPEVLYSLPGSYDVMLVVSSFAETDTLLIENYITILESPVLQIDQIDPIACFGDCTGSLEVSVINDLEISEYIWSNGGDSTQIFNICGDQELTVTVTAENGCSTIIGYYIVQPDSIQFELTTSNTGCLTDDGCAEITGLSDPENYAIIWSDGSMGPEVCSLGAAEHIVTITDTISGCTQIANFLIEENSGPDASVEILNESCKDACNGEILLITPDPETVVISWSTGWSGVQQIDVCAGTFSVSVTGEDGCVTEILFSVEDGDPEPVPGFEPSTFELNLAVDSVVVFNNTSENAVSYIWDFGDGQTSEEQNPSHIYTDTGEYMVTLYAINGNCIQSFSTTITVSFESSLSEQYLQQSIDLYPNPARDEIIIYSGKLAMAGLIEVMDIHGRICKQYEVKLAENTQRLNTSGLIEGVYLIRVMTELGPVTKRVIIHP